MNFIRNENINPNNLFKKNFFNINFIYEKIKLNFDNGILESQNENIHLIKQIDYLKKRNE